MARKGGKILQPDVLIIGGGIAAFFAAIKAKEKNRDAQVLVVDKATPGRSGCSVFAAGIFPYWMPGDDLESYQREIIVENAQFLVDQAYVEIALRESFDRFQDLVKMGVEFLKDDQGQIRRIPALSTRYGLCSPFTGGSNMMWKVRSEALRRGVKLLDRIMITDLLRNDRGCLGAAGFHTRDGSFWVFHSRATVLAAGSLHFTKAPMGSSGSAGDGPALGLKAGLPLRNMEQLADTTIGPKMLGSPGLHVIFGSGGIMVNAGGERFMERYDPQLKEEAKRCDLARAILTEWQEGRGPCYVDCTHLPREKIDVIERALPLVVMGLKSQGLSFARDRIEYIPYALGILHNGGVRITNADGEVGVPGLWVAGAAGDYCGGAESTAIACLSGSAVQGARAGIRAAQYARKGRRPALSSAYLARIKADSLDPLVKLGDKGQRPQPLMRRLLEVVFRHIHLLKSGPQLQKAIKEIETIKGQLDGLGAREPHELQKAHELRNMTYLAEAIARASLMRTETRRGHYRTDHPKRDDHNWLKWVLAEMKDGKIELSTEELPFHRWKYKPQNVAAGFSPPPMAPSRALDSLGEAHGH